MDDVTKDELTRQFRTCLEQLPEDCGAAIEAEGPIDLYSLFSELTALKNEVRIESRQVKSALDEFKAVFTTLQDAQEQMSAELVQGRKDRLEVSRAILRPLLRELLDLHDRIATGLKTTQTHRPSLLFRCSRRDTRLLESLREGQQISLRRLDALLASYQVRPVEVVGEKFDPNCMHAAATEHRPDLADALVTTELRRGFTWHEELLRIPEVKINKIVRS